VDKPPTPERLSPSCHVIDQNGNLSWTFGTFRLSPPELLLTDSGIPVRLGPSAFAILVALVQRAGDVVGSDELMTLA